MGYILIFFISWMPKWNRIYLIFVFLSLPFLMLQEQSLTLVLLCLGLCLQEKMEAIALLSVTGSLGTFFIQGDLMRQEVFISRGHFPGMNYEYHGNVAISTFENVLLHKIHKAGSRGIEKKRIVLGFEMMWRSRLKFQHVCRLLFGSYLCHLGKMVAFCSIKIYSIFCM